MNDLNISVQQNQKQELRMSAETIQSIRVLQMSRIELLDHIEQELCENPALEEVGANTESLSAEAFKEDYDNSYDYDPLNAYDSYDSYGDYGQSGASEYERFAASEETLTDHLLAQLAGLRLKGNVIKATEYLIGCVDDDGYILSLKPDLILEVSRSCGCSSDDAMLALDVVQAMDPAGVGATSLNECLELQLALICSEKALPVMNRLIDEMLPDVADNRISKIAKELKVSTENAQKLVDIVKGLEPKPGRRFSDGRAIEYIIPDVVVEIDGERRRIKLNNRGIPKLEVNSYYKGLIAGNGHVDAKEREELRSFLGNRIDSAQQLIASIKQRGDTLIRITEAIIERQEQFFQEGNRMLRPLTMLDIAEDTGLHVSTVSRAVNDKYLECAGNTYSFRHFFGGGAGGEIASSSVKDMVMALVRDEDKSKPLSDAKITELLGVRGVDISRRTVAKYRDELGIAAASKRKKF